jgi:hypothetical protein
LSLGLGLLLGLLSATLIYFYRRRRAAKNEGSGRPREWSGKQPVDGESLLGFKNQGSQRLLFFKCHDQPTFDSRKTTMARPSTRRCTAGACPNHGLGSTD